MGFNSGFKGLIVRYNVSYHIYASFMLMLHINVPQCELVEKPKTAEGWMLLFCPQVRAQSRVTQFFISGNSGPFEEASLSLVTE